MFVLVRLDSVWIYAYILYKNVFDIRPDYVIVNDEMILNDVIFY